MSDDEMGRSCARHAIWQAIRPCPHCAAQLLISELRGQLDILEARIADIEDRDIADGRAGRQTYDHAC